MNIIKCLHYIILTTVLMLGNDTLSMTVNGKELTSIINPNQMLIYTVSDTDNLFLSIKNGNIKLGSLRLTNAKSVSDFYQYLEDNKDKLSKWLSEDGTVYAKSDGDINIDGGYVAGSNLVIFDTPTKINISDAIIKSKKIEFIGKEFKFDGCFVDTDTIQILPYAPGSIFEAIIFKLRKPDSLNCAIEGTLNFIRDETGERLLVVGAYEMNILFAPHAFETNQ